MSINSRTPLGFGLINYQSQSWHTDEYLNWRNLDAMLTSVLEDSIPFAVATGIVNTYVVTYTPAPVAYTAAMQISFTANLANTGAATVNVNGLGAKNLYRDGAALTGAEIAANQYVRAIYDGTRFQIIEPKNTEVVFDDGSITQAKLETGHPTWDASGNLSAAGTFNAAGTIETGGAVVISHNDAALTSGKVFFSTSDPSGGSNGDIWFKYTA